MRWGAPTVAKRSERSRRVWVAAWGLACAVAVAGLGCDPPPAAGSPCGGCPERASCVETAEGDQCWCDPGFRRVGGSCENLNECASTTCPGTSTCTDTFGGFVCTCPPGDFTDACKQSPSPCTTTPIDCSPFGRCTGATLAVCGCDPGFRSTGTSCVPAVSLTDPALTLRQAFWARTASTFGNFLNRFDLDGLLTRSSNDVPGCLRTDGPNGEDDATRTLVDTIANSVFADVQRAVADDLASSRSANGLPLDPAVRFRVLGLGASAPTIDEEVIVELEFAGQRTVAAGVRRSNGLVDARFVEPVVFPLMVPVHRSSTELGAVPFVVVLRDARVTVVPVNVDGQPAAVVAGAWFVADPSRPHPLESEGVVAHFRNLLSVSPEWTALVGDTDAALRLVESVRDLRLDDGGLIRTCTLRTIDGTDANAASFALSFTLVAE